MRFIPCDGDGGGSLEGANVGGAGWGCGGWGGVGWGASVVVKANDLIAEG